MVSRASESNTVHVCFDQDLALRPDLECNPEFVGPDHPLLEAAISWVQSYWRQNSPVCGEALPVLVDPSTIDNSWRILFYLEWTLKNADRMDSTIDHKAQFVEIDCEGNIQKIGASAYLAYEVVGTEFEKTSKAVFRQTQSQVDHLTDLAERYATNSLAQGHLREVSKSETERLNREQTQVEASLQAEIIHQQRSIDSAPNYGLRVQHESKKADLESRLAQRMKKIERQRNISPSGIIVRRVAVIIPAGILHK